MRRLPDRPPAAAELRNASAPIGATAGPRHERLARDWLLDPSPPRAGRPGSASSTAAGSPRRATRWPCSGSASSSPLVLMAIAAPLLATHNPYAQDLAERLLPPLSPATGSAPTSSAATSGAASSTARASPSTSCLLVTVTAPVFGLLIGTVAGYYGGWIDRVLMRFTDIFLAFPRLILALAFVAALGPGIEQRRPRHRADRLAALRPRRPRRDPDRAQLRLYRRRPPPGRQRRAHPPRPHRADVRALGDRPRHPRHGRDHPDRRRPRLPRPRRPAAAAGMGADDLVRPQVPLRPVVGGDDARPRDLHRPPRLQPARRRPARRPRSAKRS